MDRSILALTDYKGRFGSKHFDSPYRSGLDKKLLSKEFKALKYSISFKYFHELTDHDSLAGRNVIYTSSEDVGYQYKSYIEDVVYSLELNKVSLIPPFKFLKANNDKVFMEFFRSIILPKEYKKLRTYHFGSIKDLKIFLSDSKIDFPVVLKSSEGASGSGVSLVKKETELFEQVKKISRTFQLRTDVKDYLRPVKHKGYQRESRYRKKFILQEFIPNLKHDWKIYFFGEKLYVFKRPILKGRGIKASGGGYDNYLYDKEADISDDLFNYAYGAFKALKIPHVSLDIAFDGNKFYLIEFQGLYFGTAGIPYSRGYFLRNNKSWTFIEKKISIEKAYAESIVWFISNR